MTFEKRLKLRLLSAVVCFLAGIGMIAISTRLQVSREFLYLHSFYCGGGGGLVGASMGIFARTFRLLKDKELLREAEIKEMDERNIHIQRVSYSLFVSISLSLTCVASFIAGLFSPLVCFVLLAVVACQIILLLLVTLIVRRIY